MNKINKIIFSDDVSQLSKVDKFVAADWSQLLGSGFANLIDEAFSQNSDGGLSNRMSSALFEAETFLGSGLANALDDQNYQTQIEQNFISIDENGIELTQLDQSRIAFKSGNIEFSIEGQNFNADLLEVMNLINSGSSFDHVVDAIAGQVTTYQIRDLSSGQSGNALFSFSINSPSTDSNSLNAEYLSVNFMDVEIRLDGSFPRDISTIHNWLKSGFSLDYIYEQNSTVSGISLNTATGNKISLNGTGLSLEVPYVADGNVDGVTESYLAKVSIDTTINDLQNIDPYNSYLDGISIEDIRVDGSTQTLLNQISLTMTDQVWSLNIDEAELRFEGNFTGANALHDDPVEVTLDKATLTTNGNKLVEIVEENAQQADGSTIIGDEVVLD